MKSKQKLTALDLPSTAESRGLQNLGERHHNVFHLAHGAAIDKNSSDADFKIHNVRPLRASRSQGSGISGRSSVCRCQESAPSIFKETLLPCVF